jgi:uncharacterized protein DUF4386
MESAQVTTGRESPQVERPSTLLVSGWVAGVLAIVFIVSLALVPKTQSAANTLSNYNSGPSFYALFAIASGLFAVVAVPYFAGLGSLLRSQGHGLASGATLLSVVGVVFMAAAAILIDSSLATVASTAAPSPADARYAAALWLTITLPLFIFGMVALGAGLFLFGVLAWNSRILPNWLAIVAIVGGVAGWIWPLFFVTIIFVMATVIIWGFASGLLAQRGLGAATAA